ncbi:MAG: ROK family protein [Acidimicrobiia bacterium]|nr:ROK family protein [Acidimicrobiia bacterium]
MPCPQVRPSRCAWATPTSTWSAASAPSCGSDQPPSSSRRRRLGAGAPGSRLAPGGGGWQAGPMGGYTIGVDVGGTKVLGVAVDPEAPHLPLATEVVPTPHGVERLVAVVLSIVAGLRGRVGGGDDRVGRAADVHGRGGMGLEGIGVGIAGLLDLAGVLRLAPNLVHEDAVEVGRRLGRELDVPLVVDNDANCAAIAEVVAGVAKGRQEVVYAALGTGIGGAVVSGGQVLRGANGFAGEPGHMTVARGGWPCACGRSGCWEAYASGTGLARLGREAAERAAAPAGGASRRAGRGAATGVGGVGILDRAGGRMADVRGEHVTDAAAAGDATALAVLEDFAGWVALGLSNLVNLLDPEVVVLGGTMIEVGEVLMRPVRAAFRAVALGSVERGGPPIEAAAFGARAAATGAALLAAGLGAEAGAGPGAPGLPARP